jgi:DNA polymerase I-like protein with 3'-5' exonuclease and polymerase domains
MRPLPPLPDWLQLEHEVAHILTQQELHGWYFDERSAWELESSLRKELEELTQVLRNRHPFVAGSVFNPKRNNRTQGYVAGAESIRLKELNPTSRDHIAWILTSHYGWTPSSISSNGKPVVDEIILKDIGTDIALDFLRCLELKKALGMISVGVNAWLKLCTTSSRIHHHCSVATNTFRCAHRKPNLAQVPADEKFRKLFTATPGMVMCGADLSGIELRMLAHYLARYDQGRYANILLTGDIHQVNAEKIGISRRAVKTVTYAFLYGAGDAKIGLSVDKQLSPDKARAKGKEVRAAFIAAIPGLSELLQAVKKRSATGKILAIDGREIYVDSQHKALNYLLQCSAGVIAKRWLLIADETIKEAGLSTHQLAFIHDELQYECEPKDIDDVKFTLEHAAVRAGEYYNLRCPIAAESKSGSNWSEVH